MRKIIFLFAGLILGIILLFQFSKYSLYNSSVRQELVLSLIALSFFALGIWLTRREKSKAKANNRDSVDYRQVKSFQISSREYDVLESLAEGMTNKEIAAKLFLSESTIKSHVSSLFQKLEASNRTEVVNIAKKHGLLFERT